MNIKQIEVFNAIMTTGSVSDAARLLHLSVPAVSQALAHMESRLGFLLFKRVKGRLYPTQEARTLAKKAEPICRELVEIDNLCKDLKLRKEGFINIVSSIGLGQLLIPEATVRFYKKHYQIRIRYENLRYEPIKESLLKQNADFGISVLPIDHPNLNVVSLAQGSLFVVCSLSHPLAKRQSTSIREIAHYELIGYPCISPWGQKISTIFENNGCSPNVSVEVGTPQNAFAMVSANVGIAVVDEFSLMAYKGKDLAAIPVMGEEPLVANLVYLQTEPLTKAAETFIEILKHLIDEIDLEPATIYR